MGSSSNHLQLKISKFSFSWDRKKCKSCILTSFLERERGGEGRERENSTSLGVLVGGLGGLIRREGARESNDIISLRMEMVVMVF